MPSLPRIAVVPLLLLFLGSCSKETPLAAGSTDATQTPRRRRLAEASNSAVVPVSLPVTGTVPEPKPQPCPKRPNILIIVLDTTRSDATQLDPKSRNRTPVLRELAKRGVNFTRTYSTWDSTPPSHFSILSGFVSGYMNPDVDQPEVSIAHQIRKLGYRTFGISANPNLTKQAFRAVVPFDTFISLQDEYQALSAAEKEKLIPKLDERIHRYNTQPEEWYRLMGYSSADEVRRRLVPLLGGKGPFFGLINLMEAHDPYFPSQKFYDPAKDPKDLVALRYRKLSPELEHPDQIPDPDRKAEVEKLIKLAQGRPWSVSIDVSDEHMKVYRRRYEAAVRQLDEGVGRIMDLLRQRGLLDSTIVIITADHGEAFGEAHLLTHSFDNQGDRDATNRVPMLFLFPACYGFKPANVDDLVTIADISPTLYDVLGIDTQPLWRKTAPGEYGRSLLSLMESGAGPQVQRVAAKPAQAPRQTVTPEQRNQQDEEALKRFRSLGYLQ